MIGACRIAIFARIVWYLGINMRGIGRWIIPFCISFLVRTTKV